MVRFRVVLVSPLYGGNIGHTARACANFGVEDLVLVDAPELDEEAFDRAVHAKPLLLAARRAATLEEALEGAHLVVATSRRLSGSDSKHLRKPLALPELPARLSRLPKGSVVALVFGREDAGLTNEEVRRADVLCSIPTHERYGVMNLSHAVATVLYEVAARPAPRPLGPVQIPVEPHEREHLHRVFHELLVTTRYPAHKRQGTEDLFRAVLGRTFLSKWEYHTLMGVFRTTLWHFGQGGLRPGEPPAGVEGPAAGGGEARGAEDGGAERDAHPAVRPALRPAGEQGSTARPAVGDATSGKPRRRARLAKAAGGR